jgi:hypothetical protein
MLLSTSADMEEITIKQLTRWQATRMFIQPNVRLTSIFFRESDGFEYNYNEAPNLTSPNLI